MQFLKKISAVISIIFPFFVISCASTPVQQAPAWITTDVRFVYNESEYLATVGDGNSEDLAKYDALNKLSQYFETKVRSEGVALRTTTDSSFSSSSVQTISVKSNADLFCVEYDKYYDKKQNKYYCAAFINRAKAWERYEPKVAQAQKKFMAEYNAAFGEMEELKKVIRIKRCFSPAQEYLVQLDYAHSLYPSGAASYEKDRDTIAGLDEELFSTRESITMGIEVVGDKDGKIKGTLTQIIGNNQGFRLVSGKSGDYFVRAVVEKNDIKHPEDYDAITAEPRLSVEILKGAECIFPYNKGLKKITAFNPEVIDKKVYGGFVELLERDFADEMNKAFERWCR